MIMRAIEHGDLVKIDIFIAQFQDSLCDKLGLLATIVEADNGRLHGV